MTPIKDRCEVCGLVLTERPVANRRRCRDHLAQGVLFPIEQAKPRRRGRRSN